MTLREACREVERRFQKAGIVSSVLEARMLTEFVFHVDRQAILLDLSEQPDSQVSRLKQLADQRISGYPLQYILGSWDFYGLSFRVGEGVLIPRPDTETLVESGLYLLEKIEKTDKTDTEPLYVADLCSGTGCVAIALEKHTTAQVYAVEYAAAAFKYLTENIRHLTSRVQPVLGDVLQKTTLERLPALDLILSNPPYLTAEDMNHLQREVQYEPSDALYGQAEDGLYFYRQITALWKSKLKTGGWMAYEIGAGQEAEVAQIMQENGFEHIGFRKDLSGIPRVIYGQYDI